MPGSGRMVIDASRTFRCPHTYVAVKEAGVPLFLCATCGYKTELLPLRKAGGAVGPAALVSLNSVRANGRTLQSQRAGGR